MSEFKYTFNINKSISEDKDLYIYGVASNDSPDRDDEVVDLGSLETSFKSFLATNPVLMYNHDLNSPAVGKIVSEFIGKDKTVYKSGIIGNELRIVAKVSETADLVRKQVKEGILRSFSVGGSANYSKKAGKTILKFTDLHEVSIVSIPANKDSIFRIVKNICVGEHCPTKINKENDNMDIQEIVNAVKADLKAETEEKSVIKGLNEKITNLESEITELKSKTVKKGVQEESPAKQLETDITSILIARHYTGGN